MAGGSREASCLLILGGGPSQTRGGMGADGRGHSSPGASVPSIFFFFFWDQVVQVRLQQDQLPRWSGVKVINNARDEKVPWGGCGQTSKDLQNKSG